MYFSKKMKSNRASSSVIDVQWKEVTDLRNNAELQETVFPQLKANEGEVPKDVYKDFDRQTVEVMHSDDGDAFLNDIMPLTRAVSIGKLVSKFAQASTAGVAQTSMTGQVGVKLDQVEFKYDGCIVPVTDAAFGRNWREWEGQRSEGFDALVDDQREITRQIRISLADQFLDGHKDKDGNLLVVDGVSWGGMRNDSRVNQVNLGAGGLNFDFTDTSKTYAEIEAAFKLVNNVLYIDNNSGADAGYYVSRQVASNLQRNSSESYDSQPILNRLAQIMGVAFIKSTSKLDGNQMMAFPLNGSVRPVSGMGINTVALPRVKYNDPVQFIVWAAIGFQIKTDYNGNSPALYAAG